MSRFSEPNDPVFRALDSSIGYDRRLGPHDVAQSRAHATMLAAAGIIGEDERDALLSGLDQVAAELEGGTFPFAPDDVDIHMAVERRLTDLVGPVGGKLHTARSRNDQVATDLVLFTRAHAEAALAGSRALRDDARRARRAPPRLGDAGLHAPPARPAGLPLAPPARLLLDARPRRPALRVRARGDARSCRSARARWRA